MLVSTVNDTVKLKKSSHPKGRKNRGTTQISESKYC